MAVKEFDMVRSKIFNFHSVCLVIIAKLRTKSIQKGEICEYKTDTFIDGNLMPIKMFWMLFPYNKITNINKSIDKNSITYLWQLMHTTNGRMQGHHNLLGHWVLMQFLSSVRQWNIIIRDAWLWDTPIAEDKLWDHKGWTKRKKNKWPRKTSQRKNNFKIMSTPLKK